MFIDNRGDSAEEDAEAPKIQVKESEAPSKADPVGNKLKFSTSFKEDPMFEGQAKLYPESVKVVDERYIFLNVNSKADMDRYSEIRLSNLRHGRYVITSDEKMQWSDQQQTWLVVFRIQERMFKSFLTNEGPPSE